MGQSGEVQFQVGDVDEGILYGTDDRQNLGEGAEEEAHPAGQLHGFNTELEPVVGTHLDVAFAVPDNVEVELDGGGIVGQFVHHDVVQFDGNFAKVCGSRD